MFLGLANMNMNSAHISINIEIAALKQSVLVQQVGKDSGCSDVRV